MLFIGIKAFAGGHTELSRIEILLQHGFDVPRDHPLAARQTIDLADTLPFPQVCFEQGTGLRDVIDGLFARIGASPDIAYETREDQVVAGLVAHHFGIAVVPYMDLLQKLDVAILQIVRPSWERKFCLIYDPKTYETPAARSFRRFVLEQAKA